MGKGGGHLMVTALILINGVRKIGAKYQHDKQIQQVTTIDRCFVNRVLGDHSDPP